MAPRPQSRHDTVVPALGAPKGRVFRDGAGRVTFAGATLASLGVTPGTYVWTWASGSLTLFIVPSWYLGSSQDAP
jgi:hypothetical protein